MPLGKLITSNSFKPCFSCKTPTTRRYVKMSPLKTTPMCERCYDRLSLAIGQARFWYVVRRYLPILLILAALIGLFLFGRYIQGQ